MELELDFSEEEVEFADRSQLNNLLKDVQDKIANLIESFSLGNAIKNGIPVAIVGATNTGKSTLLNSLLGEEKAIVSNIHGTTRDVIEDTLNIGGVTFRFIDTAGIRETSETIEIIGIERTYKKLMQANLVILVLDAERLDQIEASINNLEGKYNKNKQQLIVALNKRDVLSSDVEASTLLQIEQICKQNGYSPISVMPISAKKNLNIEKLKEILVNSQNGLNVAPDKTLVTNIRHYQALCDAQIALDRVEDGLESSIPTDLVAQDIREALYHLGSIVGEINTDEILGNIFGRFCIGK